MIGQIVGLLVGTVGLGGLIAIGLLLWIASNPANAERVAYWFASAFRFVSKKAEETALKTDVTHRINDFAVRMSRNVEGYSPPGLEVKFVEGVEPNAFMNEGRLVVRLHARSERDHNFLTVAVLYVAHTLFPIVKLQLRPNQREALDLQTTESLIRQERAALLEEFLRGWVNPAIHNNEQLENLLAQLGQVDQGGFFGPVLCQELHLLAGRLIGAANREALRNEIANFIDFLERRALRRVGDVTVPSTYVGPMLRLGVQIVSISSRREEEGGDPKVWVDYAVKNYAQAGIDRVYFIGEAADPNRNLIESVADSFVGRTGWQRFASREYPARIFAHDGSERQVRNYLVVCRRPA